MVAGFNFCKSFKILIIMFSLFSKNPTKKLEKEYKKVLLEARDIQRSGDLKLYAKKMEEAESIAQKIAEISITS